MNKKLTKKYYLCLNYNDDEDIEIAHYGLIYLSIDTQKRIQKAVSFLVKEPDFFTVTLRDGHFVGFDLQDCTKKQSKFVTGKLERDGKNEDYVEITKKDYDMFNDIEDSIDFGYLIVNVREIKGKVYGSFYCYGYTDTIRSMRIESSRINF